MNTDTGVASSSTAPTAPPARLRITSIRTDSPPVECTRLKPDTPVVTWPGKIAIAEVMLAARGSSPLYIKAGKVRNEPPPASAFWAPAMKEAAINTRCATVM